MKRYLIHTPVFDCRAAALTHGPENLKLHTINNLKNELGLFRFEQKIKNFQDAGNAPFSIVAYHNQFYEQARYAYIHELYYPSLTASCALGERILNHLILDLREYFTTPKNFKQVHKKKSFENWDVMIETLSLWEVFQHEDVKYKFVLLKTLRNKSIHFNTQTYINCKDDALIALQCLTTIINFQFGILGKKLLLGTDGIFFISKEAEKNPFIKKYYLPQCQYVGPYFLCIYDNINKIFLYFDWDNYENREISDDEFAYLYMNRKPEQLPPAKIPLKDNSFVPEMCT